MNGNGYPDCHVAESENLYEYGITDYWQDDIRTNCPKACGVCSTPEDDQNEGADDAPEDEQEEGDDDAPEDNQEEWGEDVPEIGDSCDCNKKKKTCKPIPCKKKNAKKLAKACKKTLKSKKCKKAIQKAPECLYQYLA